MRFTQAGAVAALLSASSAFLLPPTISQADTDIISTLPFEDATTIDTRVMEINCPGCAALPSKGKMYMQHTQTMLKLNFSIAHQDRDQLLLNGLPIYPIEPVSAMLQEPLTAPLLALTNDDTWEHTWDPTLGYSIMVHHPVPASSQDQMDLVAIRLEIVEVGDKFLGGLSSIDIKLLETPSGKLMMGDAQTAQAKSEVSKPTDDDHECSTILCKWRAIIADKVSSLKKGCGSKARPAGTKGSSEHKSAEHKKKPHYGHHGRPGPHRPFRHHHRHGGFARIFKGLVLHVFIPVLIGIMVGITASLVGMVAGHIVIFVWRTVFRRGQRQQYTQVKQQEDAEAKAPLTPQGPPPEYEEAVVEKTEE